MSAAAVECAGVWKFYGDYPALSDISLQIETGTCLALIGRNGAGKTTLLRILAGLPAKVCARLLSLQCDMVESYTCDAVQCLARGT